MRALLLDTHVFIWHIEGNANISKTIRKMIDVSAQEHSIYLAAISLWEISMLAAKKCIILGMPCLEWINKAIELSRIQIAPLTASISVESCHLPGIFHEDPADRLIVATARVEGLAILTRDQRILEYSKNKQVTTVKV